MRILPLLLVAGCATAPARTALPLERVFARPEGRLPFRFAFSPDGSRLAYLQTRDELTDLRVRDLATGAETVWRAEGKQELTAEERAARERRRDRARGISRFWWHPTDPGSILIVQSGDLFLLRDGGERTRLTETHAPERNPRWAPDGSALAYVRKKNLYARHDGGEIRLTGDGGGDVACGLAEFIAMEELGRHDGFWWSPDGARIAYARTDESLVPRFSMHDYLDPIGRTVEQRYPRAGDTNATWSLHVVPAAGGEPVAMQVEDEYLVRVDWTPAGRLGVQTADRAQRTLTLHECDPATGVARTLHVERDDAWVRFHRNLRFLEDGRFLWTSERSGFNHLYLGDEALTSGDWDVAAVVAVGDGKVYVTGSRESPRERHLYAVGLDGGAVERVTTAPGWHSVTASKDGRWCVDTWSRQGQPPRVDLLDLRTGARRPLARGRPLEGMRRPEWVTIPADDGTELRGMLWRASGRAGPAIVHGYGGPGAHLVADRWGGATYLWHMRMLKKGYSILTIDNRGSGGYGRAFMRIVDGRLGDYEVRDHAAAARWLGRQPEVDPKRIGVWGWSYGGTLTLMCLLHAPDVFAAGVAVAPVTDWRDYDTAYTERYLGMPQHRREAYDSSSPITRADRLARPLLLAHGLMDDNVHARGALVFLDKAQKAGRRIETDFYPRGAHGIGGTRERTLLFGNMERFWARHLGR